jgi:hypothetical protein
MDILLCKGSQKTTSSSIRTILNTQEKIYITFSYIDLISLFAYLVVFNATFNNISVYHGGQFY